MEEYYDKETIEYAKNLNEEVKELNSRINECSVNNERERDEYRSDYARIIYSSSFRRLQGKMQLLGINHTQFHRNRLTHSLEVAQIARGIAKDLKLDTTLVVETCSLAHDLGNPPFGHHGEKILNKLTDDIGGFEGNAQTLRILMNLEKKDYNFTGLNLTIRTLLGVIKYFNKRTQEVDKFIYHDNYEKINDIIVQKKIKHKKSIDCQIMDLADEIAYAAHDLEDTLTFKYFNIDELLYEFKISDKYKESYNELNEIVNKCKEFAFKASTDNRFDTSEEFSFLFRKELTSTIVNKLIRDIGVINDEKNNQILGFKNFGKLSEGLKKLLFKSLLRKPTIQLYEKQGSQVIQGLYNVCTDKEYNQDLKLLPPEYRKQNQDNEEDKKRAVIDYISGMMDSFAISEYKKYFGLNSLDKYYFKNEISHTEDDDEIRIINAEGDKT